MNYGEDIQPVRPNGLGLRLRHFDAALTATPETIAAEQKAIDDQIDAEFKAFEELMELTGNLDLLEEPANGTDLDGEIVETPDALAIGRGDNRVIYMDALASLFDQDREEFVAAAEQQASANGSHNGDRPKPRMKPSSARPPQARPGTPNIDDPVLGLFPDADTKPKMQPARRAGDNPEDWHQQLESLFEDQPKPAAVTTDEPDNESLTARLFEQNAVSLREKLTNDPSYVPSVEELEFIASLEFTSKEAPTQPEVIPPRPSLKERARKFGHWAMNRIESFGSVLRRHHIARAAGMIVATGVLAAGLSYAGEKTSELTTTNTTVADEAGKTAGRNIEPVMTQEQVWYQTLQQSGTINVSYGEFVATVSSPQYKTMLSDTKLFDEYYAWQQANPGVDLDEALKIFEGQS